jgi:hypothetical protein
MNQTEAATGDAQFDPEAGSSAPTNESRQEHFVNIPFQDDHESNSVPSKRTRRTKGEK